MSLANRFMILFAGSDRAYGTYRVTQQEASGKIVGGAGDILTKKAAVTEELWIEHLSGRQSLGIIPIRDDNTCTFGAIDIDGKDSVYRDFDASEVARRVAALRLPLVVCRSKSGGAHLYCFANYCVTCALMQDRLKEIRALLGLPERTEIFPKQRQINAERGDVGGWINMPYFDMGNFEITKGPRYAYSDTGEPLLVEQFIDLAYNRQLSASFFNTLFISQVAPEDVPQAKSLPPIIIPATDLFYEGPPCLQRLGAEGVGEGARDNALLNIAKYLKMRFPDDWQVRTRHYADIILHPALEIGQVNKTIRQQERNSYLYSCRKEPLLSYCDGAVCRGRRYGVGRDGKEGFHAPGSSELPENFPIFGQLQRVDTEPPIFFLDVSDPANDSRNFKVQLSREDIMSPHRLRIILGGLLLVMPLPTTQSWDAMLTDLFSNTVNIEVLEPDMFWQHLQQFCSRSPARAREDVLNGKVWNEHGRSWFQLMDLMIFLRKNKFDSLNEIDIRAVFTKKSIPLEKWEIRRSTIYVWGVPEFQTPEAREARPEEGTVL